mgnify:CR=1 FL=1
MLHFGLADIKNEALCVCATDMDRPRRLYERCVARVSRCVPSRFLLTDSLLDGVVELSSVEPLAY